jgi:hypothetical protein
MTKQTGIMSSSIGRKPIMAATGVFLCSFLVVHLAGNLLLFKDDGGVAFTAYARVMAPKITASPISTGEKSVCIPVALNASLCRTNRVAHANGKIPRRERDGLDLERNFVVATGQETLGQWRRGPSQVPVQQAC